MGERIEVTRNAEVHSRTRLIPWAAGGAAMIGGYATSNGVSDWILTHWLFAYDLEFVRRGLVGTVLWTFFEPDVELARRFAISLLVVCSASVVAFTIWCLQRRPALIRIGLATLVATCPATLMQFGFDCGRFDQVNVILLLLSLGAIDRTGAIAPWMIAIFSAVALLVHEAFLVIHIPALISMMIYRSGGKVGRGAVCIGAITVAITALILRFGPMDSIDHETYQNQLVDSHGLSERSVDLSTRVLYRELPDNIVHATSTLPRRLFAWRPVVIFLVLVPWVWMALAVLRSLHSHIDSNLRRGFWLPVIASATPLALIVVASDLFRWWTLSVINLLLVTLLMLRIHPDTEINLGLGRKGISLLAGLGILVGPAGIDSAFPRTYQLRDLAGELFAKPRVHKISREPRCCGRQRANDSAG